VSRPSRMSPGRADCSSRAATFTVSPVVKEPPAAAAPVTASPVLTPMRTANSTPRSRRSSPPRAAICSRISAAARTARNTSSSCATGTPKTATTASPMNFSTVPPLRSTASRMRPNQRCIAQRSVSGSTRSASAVDLTTSAKTIVTTLRRSAADCRADSGAPHAGQNRDLSGACSPQRAHALTFRV
jgi:hypothetical protein